LFFASGQRLVAAELSRDALPTVANDVFSGISELAESGITASRGFGSHEVVVVVATDDGVRAAWLDEDLKITCPPEF
jgi:hypothetical protein